MALEDLGGTKYIDALNDAWPLGSDSPSAGDDHIRGVKHVLKTSFPTITGALTRTLASLNTSSVPIGSKLAFYQAAAPVGWTRVAGIVSTYALRIVTSVATTGGASGGTDDPIANAKIPSHTHPATGLTTGTESVSHNHYIPAHTTSLDAAHFHQSLFGTAAVASGSFVTAYISGSSVGVNTQTGAAHQHNIPDGWTGNMSASHTHAISGSTAANAGAATWAPRYMDFILCERTS